MANRSDVPDSSFLVLTVLEIIISVIVVVGNALVVADISRFKTLQYPSNIMIAALAVTDFLVASVFIPYVLIRTNMPHLFATRLSCLMYMFTTHTIPMLSIVINFNLSVERLYAVQFPFHYHANVTTKRNLFWNVISAGGITLINTPITLGIDLWSENQTCYAPTLLSSEFSRLYITLLIVIQLAGFLSYLRVVVAEVSFRRRDNTTATSNLERQVSRQSLLSVIAYGISCLYLPHVIYYLWGTISRKQHDALTLGLLQLLDLCSSAVNCFIYGFKKRKFRDLYWDSNEPK